MDGTREIFWTSLGPSRRAAFSDEAKAVDRNVVFERAALAMAPRVVGVFRHSRPRIRVPARYEGRMRADLGFVELGSLLDVGLDEELTSRTEQTGDMVEYVRPDDESLRVPPFPPRIGKMKEEGGERTIRGQSRECQPDVLGEDTTSFGKSMTQKALVHDDRPFALDLEPEKADVSLSGQATQQETPAPRPHLHLETGKRPREQGSHVDRPLLGQPGCRGVPASRLRREIGVHHGPIAYKEARAGARAVSM
jgi:hypothetical protein